MSRGGLFNGNIVQNSGLTFSLTTENGGVSDFENFPANAAGNYSKIFIPLKEHQARFLNNTKIKIPHNYIWVSQNQMIEMISKKKIDIEARLLFGCININKIK